MGFRFTRDALCGDSAGALVGVLDDEAVPDGMPFVLDTTLLLLGS